QQTKKMFALVRRDRDGTLRHRTLQRRMKPIRAEIERLLEEAAASPCLVTKGKAKAILKHREGVIASGWSGSGLPVGVRPVVRAERAKAQHLADGVGSPPCAGELEVLLRDGSVRALDFAGT